jgi:hypothetical protein
MHEGTAFTEVLLQAAHSNRVMGAASAIMTYWWLALLPHVLALGAAAHCTPLWCVPV